MCLFFKEILTACIGSCGEKYGKNYRKTAGIHDASCIRSTQQTSFETTSLDDFKSATECCELMAVKGTFGEGCPEAGKLLTFFGDIGACCKGGCGLSQPSRGLSIELNLSRLPLKPQRDSTKNFMVRVILSTKWILPTCQLETQKKNMPSLRNDLPVPFGTDGPSLCQLPPAINLLRNTGRACDEAPKTGSLPWMSLEPMIPLAARVKRSYRQSGPASGS